MHSLVSMMKALSDATRVRAFSALRDGELCVCQLIALLQLAPSTVSRHMSILKQARLVESRKDGRWVYYRLADRADDRRAGELIAWACEVLSSSDELADDRARLQQIVALPLEDVCRGSCCR